MFKRRSRAALAVLLALPFLVGGALRFGSAARAESTPNYAQLWADQKDLMETKWASTVGLGLTPWTGNTATSAPKIGDVWHVTSVEQLCYVFSTIDPDTTVSQTIKISIDANLDFGGVTKKRPWEPVDLKGHTLSIDGNNYTLYNLLVDTVAQNNSSFITNLGDDSEIRNMTFSNVILRATGKTRHLVPYPDTRLPLKDGKIQYTEFSHYKAATLFGDVFRDRIVFANIGMENALVSTDAYWAFAFMMVSKEQARTKDNFTGVTIENCYTRNVVCYAPGEGTIACTSAFIGGGGGSTDAKPAVYLNRCYSIDSMVISGAGHSGGFSSCNSGNLKIENCFSDVVVYGSQMTGAFQGVMHHGNYEFENCFALGSVEGKDYIGGFAATYHRQLSTNGYKGDTSVTFRNCYSGAITGMVGGGTKMGSFIGAASYQNSEPSLSFPGPDAYRFENCYAMGETGNIELDVSSPNGNPGTVGGFIGDEWTFTQNGTTFAYQNCYYDKQTTAMREWAVGTEKTRDGIKGVLTTDTAKAGRGLAGTAGTDGFAAFLEPDPDKLVWNYTSGQYPELTVFRAATAEDWREPYLVRAYSAASVAAIHLDPWADIPSPLVYDTVRDLTVGFDLSTGVQWKQIPNPHRTADDVLNPAQPTVTLYGEKLPVLTLETKGAVTYGRNPAPGIQWLSANAAVYDEVKNCYVTGQRRLRVIPTANLHPGKSAFILTGKTTSPHKQTYDHADDVFMAYSSGVRLYNSDMLDITQGIYPDEYNPDPQDPQGKVEAKSTGADFTSEIGKYENAATPNLVTGSRISVTGMRLAYYDESLGRDVYNVDGGTITGGAFGAVDNLNLHNPPNPNRWSELFNGNAEFTNQELGLYALKYRWTLPDGRYLEGGKIVSVLNGLSKVHIEVKDLDGTPVGDEVIPGIRTGGSDPALTGETLSELTQENIAYGTPTVAGWKHIADPAAIREVIVDIGRNHFDADATKGTMTVKRRYYTNFYMERDRMFVTQVNVNKEYKLMGPDAQTAHPTFLRLKETPVVSEIPEFAFRDLEEDVHILIRLRVRQIYVNLRQIVRTPATVALPEFGYGKLNGIASMTGLADYTQSRNVMFPTWKDTVPPALQVYKRYRLPVKAFYRLTPIIPQYYELERMTHDLSSTGTANETTDPSVVLDYRTKDEYWVTVWLTSKLNPHPNNTVRVEENVFAEPIPAPANP